MEQHQICKGIEEYGKKERAEGVLTTLIDLVQKGLLSVKDAAEQICTTPEEFREKMREREGSKE